jgi:hypothetical protein
LNDPAVKGIIINSRDVTEIKRQERELKEANDRFELVLRLLMKVYMIGILFQGNYIGIKIIVKCLAIKMKLKTYGKALETTYSP